VGHIIRENDLTFGPGFSTEIVFGFAGNKSSFSSMESYSLIMIESSRTT
jgi:hypothetical protein